MKALMILGLATIAVVIGSADSAPAAATGPAFLAVQFPILDGSTTTAPLARLIACDVYGVRCVWNAPASANVERTYIPDPSSGPSPAATSITSIKFSTTHNAYVNLIEGKVDALLEARVPSADEEAAAKQANVQLHVEAFALDAFVFLTNVRNPATSLPLDGLRDVYAGKLTTWDQLGVDMGEKTAPIHAYQRERNSGSQELLRSMVMGAAPIIDAPDMIVTTMLGPYNALGGDPKTGQGGDRLGLCYSVFYYASVMFANPQVKMVGVDGVLPTSASIASRTYPLTAPVYLVTRHDAAPDGPALRFRDWLLSADGQRLIGQSGYVPVQPQTR